MKLHQEKKRNIRFGIWLFYLEMLESDIFDLNTWRHLKPKKEGFTTKITKNSLSTIMVAVFSFLLHVIKLSRTYGEYTN